MDVKEEAYRSLCVAREMGWLRNAAVFSLEDR